MSKAMSWKVLQYHLQLGHPEMTARKTGSEVEAESGKETTNGTDEKSGVGTDQGQGHATEKGKGIDGIAHDLVAAVATGSVEVTANTVTVTVTASIVIASLAKSVTESVVVIDLGIDVKGVVAGRHVRVVGSDSCGRQFHCVRRGGQNVIPQILDINSYPS